MNTQDYVIKLTANITEFTSNLDKAGEKMKMTSRQAQQFNKNLSKALSSSSPSVQQLGRNLKSLGKQFEKASDQFNKYSEKAKDAGQRVSELSQIQIEQANAVAQTKERIDELTNAYIEAKSQAEELSQGHMKSVRAYSDALEKNQKQIESTKASLKEYYSAIEHSKATTADMMSRATTQDQKDYVKQVEAQELETLNNKYSEKLDLLKQLEAEHKRLQQTIGAASKAEGLSDALKEQGTQLKQQEAQLTATEASLLRYGDTAQQAESKAYEFASATSDARDQIMDLSSQAANASGNVSKISIAFNFAKKTVSSFLSVIAKLVKGGFGILKGGFGILKGVFGKLGEHIKNTVKDFRKTRNESNLLDKAVNKLTKTFSSYGSLLIRRFRRNIITNVFNGLREGVRNVAKESSSFNAAISSMFGSLKTFSNALGSAVAPLVEAAAPVITSFVNMLTGAVNTVSQLVSGITGKSSFLKAIPVNYDYAKSLDNTADSADNATKATNKANKATKEYQKTVMSFDELHTLNGKDAEESSDYTSSSSNPSDATQKAFQNQQIDSKVKGIADQLADAFKNHDWDKLGSMMAEGVNKAFAWVDNLVKWENCGEKITEIVNGITSTFNSFVYNLDWALIGQTIGDGFNTVVNTLWLFITGIDWGALGAGFGEGLKSLFETVDWSMVGALLVAKVQALLYFIQGLVSTPELFETIGTALRDAIGGMIDELDPTAWGDTISKVINGFFTILAEGFSDFDKFSELGEKLATNLNTAVDGIDADKFGEGVSNLIISLLSALISFIETTDWEAFGQKVADMISAVDWAGVADKLFEAIGAALAGLTDFIWGLIKDAWEGVVNYWKDKCFEDGKFSIGGLLDGIVEGLKNIGTWIVEHIFKPFIDGFKKAFGIASPSKEMKKQGGFVIDGLLGGIVNALKDIGTWVTDHIFTPILDAIKTAFGFVGDVAQGVFDIGKGIVSGIVDGLSGIGDSITSALSTVEGVLKAPFEAAWNFISPIIDGIMNFKLPNWVTDNFITNGISSAGNAIGGWFKDVGSFITFADGGFPETGDLFFANEAGPEYIGSIGSRTAVANNDQITTGISYAVADAVVPILLDMLTVMKSGNNQGTVIDMDGERIARIVTKYQNRISGNEYTFA